jgi:hypothetical protein
LRDVPGFLKDNAVRHEQRIDVAGDAGGVISQCHRRPADDEDVGDYAALHKPIAEGGERPLDLRPVEENTPRFGHAASRSAAER